jgi:hypothetical protein
VSNAATASARWTGWMSEEFGGPLACPSNMVVIGVECRGSFCDQVRLRCDTFPNTFSDASVWESPWIEHGGDIFGNGATKEVTCPDNEWVTGMECMGDYCDNVKILCKSTGRAAGTCAWTADWYSEEQGAFTVPADSYIRGVRCAGMHCDNKQYFVCQARPAAANSCRGRCDVFSSSHSCQCDDACSLYGDCCTDHALHCG